MVGWTLGAGWEYAFAEKWSAKIEYLYYDLGTIANTMTPANGATGITFEKSSTRINGNIVRARDSTTNSIASRQTASASPTSPG